MLGRHLGLRENRVPSYFANVTRRFNNLFQSGKTFNLFHLHFEICPKGQNSKAFLNGKYDHDDLSNATNKGFNVVVYELRTV